MLTQIFTLLPLAFAQSVSFSIVSRSRNRNNIYYHIIAATFSNAVWFATFKNLITADMNWILFLPYTIGTVSGSVVGVKISQKIETWLHAESDNHLKSK